MADAPNAVGKTYVTISHHKVIPMVLIGVNRVGDTKTIRTETQLLNIVLRSYLSRSPNLASQKLRDE